MALNVSHHALVEPKSCDEDMTPSDTTIVYKVSSFLHLHSDFWYNSLGSTCTCHYLNVGTNMSQRASSSKWLEAIEDEIKSMNANKVWDLEIIPK